MSTTDRKLSVSIERFPIAGVFSISRGSRTEAVVVTATVSDGGVTGRGECVPYARYGETVEGVAAAIEALGPMVAKGLDRDGLQEALPPGAARNALDCALWDLDAKRAGVPAHVLAGIDRLGRATTAYTISLAEPDAMAEAAHAARERAILKIKLGKPEGDIRYQQDVGGGAFLDFGGYPVRAALHFLGHGLDVVGAVFRYDTVTNVVMSGSILLSTTTGIPAQLSFGMEHSYRTHYELRGSTGRLFLDRAFTPPESYQPVVRIERQDYREERVLPPDHQFANVLAFFVDAVLEGVDLEPHHTGTLAQAELIDRIRDAASVQKI